MKRVIFSFVFMLLLFSFYACHPSNEKNITHLERDDWAPDVKEGINDFMDKYAHSDNAYVVFDFDNTSSIFDIEEQLMIYQLQTMAFEISPEQLEKVLYSGIESYENEVDDYITDITNAYTALNEQYAATMTFSAKGLSDTQQSEIQANPLWLEFATKMANLYDLVCNTAGSETAYQWILNWFSGMTYDEVYALAKHSHQKYAAVPTSIETWEAPAGITSKVGPLSYRWTSGVQVSENIKELWKTLAKNNIDVWVCSASGLPQVMAAIDVFGLSDYCTGVLAMTMKQDSNGRYLPEYDFDGKAMIHTQTGWQKSTESNKAITGGASKVTTIDNIIKPRYNGAGPLAGFMDSSGDFNFCTEYKSLKMVVCMNRANRKVTDGGGLVAEVAMYQRDHLHWNLAIANEQGETMYYLQGRDENGQRTFRASNKTLRYGSSAEQLFANDNNVAQLEYMKTNNMSIKEIFDQFAIKTESGVLGFPYGFLKTYHGYHSR